MRMREGCPTMVDFVPGCWRKCHHPGDFHDLQHSEMDSLEGMVHGMTVRDRNHSISQFTIYRPGLENTEERIRKNLFDTFVRK